MPPPLLAISRFSHILATVVWLGGMMTIALLVIPELDGALAEAPRLHRTARRLRRRFAPVSGLALAVLMVTGLFQMTADPHYDGLLRFSSAWSRALLLKHVLIGLMALTGLISQFGAAPALARASHLLERGQDGGGEWRRMRRREKRLSGLMLGLALLILACSVWLASI